MQFLLSPIAKYLAIILGIISLLAGTYLAGEHNGGIRCENNHLIASIKVKNKLEKKYEKINSTKFSSDDARLKWLLAHNHK